MYNFPYFALEPQRAMTPVVNNKQYGHEGAQLRSPSKQPAAKKIVNLYPSPTIPSDLLEWSRWSHPSSSASLSQWLTVVGRMVLELDHWGQIQDSYNRQPFLSWTPHGPVQGFLKVCCNLRMFLPNAFSPLFSQESACFVGWGRPWPILAPSYFVLHSTSSNKTFTYLILYRYLMLREPKLT